MKLIYNSRVRENSDVSLKKASKTFRNFTKILLTTAVVALSSIQGLKAQYCASTALYAYDELITNVTLSSINNSSTCATVAPGPGSVAQLYGNYTTSVAPPNLTVGVTYPASVTVNTCGGYYGTYVNMYIDWNGDQDFLDAGETVYASPSIPGAATLSFNVLVPAAATPGLTRMRIVHSEYTTPTSCGSYSYGETEDYNVSIVSSAACSGTPTGGTAITSNASPCPSTSYSISLSGASTTSGLTYQWQSSTDNITFTNIAGATSSFYNTTATTSAYYRCILTCTASSLSGTSTSVQVTVNSFLNCYCTSAPNYTNDEEIFNVSLGSLNNSSSCGQTGGPGSIVEKYANYTNSTPAVAIPNLTQGFSYPLSITIGTCGGNYNNMSKAWIDYNHNGVFTDPGEEIYVSSTYTQGPHTETATIVIPATAMTGNTRMRVITSETTVATNIQPCGSTGYNWGETEDYFVNIAAPLANDAGISGFINPVVPTCNFNDTVTVTLFNYGTDTLTSASINWSWNSVVQTPGFWTGSIPPLGSTTVFVGTVAYGAGDDLAVWTSNPNGVIENPSGAYNDQSSINNLLSGMSGVYTVGGATPDFPDILTAINALNFAGVCGPTTFDIRSGTYYDQFDLGQVIGMNATNTVTFRSEVGDRDSVTFDFGAAATANNYVVLLNNADYFHFEKMTLRNSSTSFGRVISIGGGSDHNTFYDCLLETQSSNTTSFNIAVIFSNGGNDNYNTFEGNTIKGGSYGAYWYGGGITSLEMGGSFKNNEFENNYYAGLYLYYQEGIEVVGNHIFGNSTYNFRYGMYGYYLDKASKIDKNNIESNATSFWYYGMYFGNMDATSAGRASISNNMISVGNGGTGNAIYGLAMFSSGFFDIYNNSITVASGTTTSRAYYISGGGANNLANNSLTNYGGGYAAYILGSYSVNSMDYNNLYTTGANVANFDGTNCATLANWQTVSSYDASGLSVDPGYYSDFDLHVCSDSLNNAGTPLAIITDDIDGQSRNATTPDIGADEFAPLGLPGFLGADALVCTGETVCLYAGAPADDILWSTGDTTNQLCVTSPGTYTVSVIGVCGIAFDTVVVTASALSYTGFLNASSTEFCTGGSAILTSTMPASTYSWTGGSTDDTLVVTTSGTYTLNITDACGSGSESVTITVNTAPVASFTQFNSYMTVDLTNTSTSGGATTYAWNFGDGGTSTAENPTHIYTNPGMYYVTLTVTNACGTTTVGDSVLASILGLEEIAGLGTIAVYPNPSTGIFQVDFDMNQDMNVEIQVTNVLGESIFVKNLGSINGLHKDAIDITNAAPGVYYVTIVSDNTTIMTNMLVKQ